MENRREVLKQVALGLSTAATVGLLGEQAFSQSAAAANDDSVPLPFVLADGTETRGRVLLGPVMAFEPVFISHSSPNSVDWIKKDSAALNPPTGWYAATVALSSWQLRVNHKPLDDIDWHDGGVRLGFAKNASQWVVRASMLVRDDTGDDPMNANVSGIVTYYGRIPT